MCCQKQFIFICAFLLIVQAGCISTKKVRQAIVQHDSEVKASDSATVELPQGFIVTVEKELPTDTKVKSTAIIIPLLVINYFGKDHKITLGQSSLKTGLPSFLKKEVDESVKKHSIPWSDFNRLGYSLRISIKQVDISGVFLSGFGFIAGYYTAGGSSVSFGSNYRSTFDVTYQLFDDDQVIMSKSFTINLKYYKGGKYRFKFKDNITGMHYSYKYPKRDVLPFDYPCPYANNVDDMVPSIINFMKFSCAVTSELIVKELDSSFFSHQKLIKE